MKIACSFLRAAALSLALASMAGVLAATSACGSLLPADVKKDADAPEGPGGKSTRRAGTPGGKGTPAATSNPVDPILESQSPAGDARDVLLGARVVLTFNVAPSAGQDFGKALTLQDGPDSYVPLDCAPDIAKRTLSCVPIKPLKHDTLYAVNLGATLAFPFGRSLSQGKTWSFRTTRSDDRTPPTVTWHSGSLGGHEQGAPVVVGFSEPVVWKASGKAKFLAVGQSAAAAGVVGEVKAFGNALEVTPATPLGVGEHTLRLEGGVFDRYDNAPASELNFTVPVRTGSSRGSLTFDADASTGLGSSARAAGPWLLRFSRALLPSEAIAGIKLRTSAGAEKTLALRFVPEGVEVSPTATLAYGADHILAIAPEVASWERQPLGATGATVSLRTQTELTPGSVAPAPGSSEVALDAAWSTTFDRALAMGLAVAEFVDVRDQFGKPVKVNVTQPETNKVVVVPLAAGGWSLSKEYTVNLLPGLLGADGAGFVAKKAYSFKARVDPSWEAGPKRVFTARCNTCHPEYLDRDTSIAWASRIQGAVASGRMPLGGPLSAGDKGAVVQWFDALPE